MTVTGPAGSVCPALPEWTDLISYSNSDPYMLSLVYTNPDLVVQNSVTPSVNLAYNLGQKDFRYL